MFSSDRDGGSFLTYTLWDADGRKCPEGVQKIAHIEGIRPGRLTAKQIVYAKGDPQKSKNYTSD